MLTLIVVAFIRALSTSRTYEISAFIVVVLFPSVYRLDDAQFRYC